MFMSSKAMTSILSTLLTGFASVVLLLSVSGEASPFKERIIGGKDTNIGEVPYTVSLEYGYNHFCGGTILSDRFILTAAHCIVKQDVRFATVRTGSSTLLSGGVNYKIKRFIPNPNYNPKAVDPDVGIVELNEPIKFNDKCKPAILPDAEPSGGEIVQVSGWGFITEGGERPKMLQSIKVPVKSRQECEKIFSDFKNYSPRMICAGSSGKDACQGDSGGPAVSDGKVVGIVSWGVGCAREGFAGVYTNVAHPDVRKFIKEVTQL